MLELATLETFTDWLNSPLQDTRPPAAVQALDLRGFKDKLHGQNFHGSIFLSCTLCPDSTFAIIKAGGVIIPDSHYLTFPAHRQRLYSAAEIFEGYEGGLIADYQRSYDYKIYREFMQGGKLDTPLDVGMFRYLHDHSITDALYGFIGGRKVVAIMGGHGMERKDPYYTKIAKLSRRITKAGFLMVSGGGPGGMEATHLGAYFAARSEDEMLEAIAQMAVRPNGAEAGKEYADDDWLKRAWDILQAYPQTRAEKLKYPSIGIPTWFYGHEPPSPFPTHIAKYFSNSIREDGLLMIARHGVIFAPGSAGTRQEVFQDAAQNHYGTSGFYSPMIMLGKDYWNGKTDDEYSYPVWPLLAQSASDNYRELLAISDDEDEIEALIKRYEPEKHRA